MPWNKDDRELILSLMNVDSKFSLRDLGRANRQLGLRFAQAAQAVVKAWGKTMHDVDLIASHGQTIHHDPPFSTCQIGEPAVIAEETGVTVMSDFRSADVAAGGQGAPLTSIFDSVLMRPTSGMRALQNIGGIANVTLLSSTESLESNAVAYDTGPGNCWIDQAANMHDPSLTYDKDGKIATSGTVSIKLLNSMLDSIAYFTEEIPKSSGRELFSSAALNKWRSHAPELSSADFVATVTELTAVSIARGYSLHEAAQYQLDEVVLSGGGARNPTLVASLNRALAKQFHSRKISVKTLEEFEKHEKLFEVLESALPEGLNIGDAKEAMVFAVLGYLGASGVQSSLPSCTGATGPRCLGKLSPGKNFKAIEVNRGGRGV